MRSDSRPSCTDRGGIASAPAKFLVAPTQVVAIRAGRLFDSRSGAMLANQIVLVRGDRITDVGPAVAIPADARIIDSAEIPHGKQAGQFAYFIKWGMTPVDVLKVAFLPTARMLNYWVDQIGSIEKGKYADIIAVSGNPLTDVSEMQRVRFVMKGGHVVKKDL